MAKDPLSHVASWLALAHPDVEDPIIALIDEEERIQKCAIELSHRADILFFALPKAEREKVERMEERRLLGEIGDSLPPVRAASMKKPINCSIVSERPNQSLSPERSQCLRPAMTSC
jgi:hypothetical protein